MPFLMSTKTITTKRLGRRPELRPNGESEVKSLARIVSIKAPNLQYAIFTIKGTAPLVIHRFSHKIKDMMKRKQEEGKSASSKRNRQAKATDESYREARYVSREGWDG